MFNLIGNKKLHPFGLDISEKTVKILQLSPQKNGYKPSAFSQLDIPANVMGNHMITNEETLAEVLMKGVAMARGLVGNSVIASIPEAKSFVRIVTMPKMDMQEIDNALPWELEQDIPVPVAQVYLDWQLVDETEDKIKILAMAAPKDYIDSLITVLKLAKLKPVAFELESQSIARAAISPEDKEQSVLLVDMASTATSFVVVSKGVLEYTASIPTGGNAISDNIAQALKVDPKEAEKMKVEFGLMEDSKKGNVKQNIILILDTIIDEIRNVIKYHDEHPLYDQPISKVILSGGGSKLQGIDEYISARLNVGVNKPVGRIILCDPWVNVSSLENRAGFPDSTASLEFTTSIGLALRGMSFDENN